MLFASDGLITKIADYGVIDKIVTIITPYKGRIGVIVKGGHGMKDEKRSLSQLFTYGNFEIYEKNNTYWLRGGSVINSFYNLSYDVEDVALATYLCELANELTDENIENTQLLKLLLNSLHLICNSKKNRTLIKGVFEMISAVISGYMPDVSGCCVCQERLKDGMYLDILNGHMICSECLKKVRRSGGELSQFVNYEEEKPILQYMTKAVTMALIYLMECDDNKIFSFELKEKKDLDLFGRLCENYILHHLGMGLNSLKFYKSVKS